MSLELLRELLGWSTLINYGVLLLWALLFTQAHGWLLCVHGRWFKLSAVQFDQFHYWAMGFYKLIVLVFNLVPYLVLRLLL